MSGIRNRSPGAVLLLALALAVGFALTVGASGGTAYRAVTQANSVVYQDSTGEDAAALDIASVTVSNDDASLLTFDLKFANRSPNLSTDWIVVAIDSDRNRATGSSGWDGAEWLIEWNGESLLRHWDGAKWTNAPSMQTLVSILTQNELVIKLNAAELGNVTGFDFGIEAQVWKDPNAEEPTAWDDAPDYGHGLWSYDVKLYVAPVLTATAIKCTPEPPRAGKAMVGRTTVTVTRGTATEVLPETATVRATATVGGKKLLGAVVRTGNNVAVKWLVPKTAKGKLMRGSIIVTLEKVGVTKTFAEKVK